MTDNRIERDNEVTFGRLDEDGVLHNIRKIKSSDIAKCPFVIFVPEHYRADGTCKCDDPTEQQRMIEEWGYRASDFDAINDARNNAVSDQAMDVLDGLYDTGEDDG